MTWNAPTSPLDSHYRTRRTWRSLARDVVLAVAGLGVIVMCVFLALEATR